MHDQPPLIEASNERFHAGHYYAGSEPSNIACFDTWWEAAGHLLSDMVEYADEEDDAVIAFNPDTMSYAEVGPPDCALVTDVVQAVLRDDPPNEPEDYATEIEDNDGRRVVFWLKRAICKHQVAAI